MTADPAALRRRIGAPLLTAYGVGVMVGAGIYVLVGAVVSQAGIWAPISFALAGFVAAPTALSYAELSTRIPEAAGEAAYIAKGFGLSWLAVIVGLSIVLVGTISGAAVLRGGTGYLLGLLDFPFAAAVACAGLTLMAVAMLGVLESMRFVAILTAVEVIGLGLVVWAGFNAPVQVTTTISGPTLSGIGIGASLAFFAFIGFEDIVNMAEEVREPSRNLPIAIIAALAITTAIYVLVCYASVRAVPIQNLASSETPLALVWQAGSGGSASFLSIIAVAAAMNGALAQIVMASRVLYGLGRRSAQFAVFHTTSARFGTPLLATLIVSLLMIAAALSLPVAVLAELTSAILLVVFAIVNVALIRLKRSEPDAPFRVPVFVPWSGLILSSIAAFSLIYGKVAL